MKITIILDQVDLGAAMVLPEFQRGVLDACIRLNLGKSHLNRMPEELKKRQRIIESFVFVEGGCL